MKYTRTDIAEEVGCSVRRLYEELLKLGIKPRKRITEDDRRRILINLGHSYLFADDANTDQSEEKDKQN